MSNVLDDPEALASSQYVVVTSYRRDGTPVATPVWVVGDGDAVAVWTPRKAHKVGRIKRNPAVTIAPCSFNGTPLGPALPGRAEIMDNAGLRRVRSALKRKYGLIGWLTVSGSVLRRGADGTVAIRIVLAESVGESAERTPAEAAERTPAEPAPAEPAPAEPAPAEPAPAEPAPAESAERAAEKSGPSTGDAKGAQPSD
jgi:uncharacterized protein